MFGRVTIGALVVGTVLIVVAACDDSGVIEEHCTNIPPGGCPVAHGLACEDPTCAAVYACQPGNVWVLEQTCPAYDAGAQPDAAFPTEDASEAAAPMFDAAADAPPGAFGGPGCDTLQAPDCELGLVLSCGGCCGCEDLYVCQDEGWTLWGSCSDGGITPEH